MVFDLMTLTSNARGHLHEKQHARCCSLCWFWFDSFRHVPTCSILWFPCWNLRAGGWSMIQKSPTNEDASDVIVIWFRDAGITYLQDGNFNCWQAVILPCLLQVRILCFESTPTNFDPLFRELNFTLTNFRLPFSAMKIDYARTKFLSKMF